MSPKGDFALRRANAHFSHAQTARRANLSQLRDLVLSGKSQRSSCASRLIEEGRIAIVTRRGARDAMDARVLQ
jgi:hypothetical protein